MWRVALTSESRDDLEAEGQFAELSARRLDRISANARTEHEAALVVGSVDADRDAGQGVREQLARRLFCCDLAQARLEDLADWRHRHVFDHDNRARPGRRFRDAGAHMFGERSFVDRLAGRQRNE